MAREQELQMAVSPSCSCGRIKSRKNSTVERKLRKLVCFYVFLSFSTLTSYPRSGVKMFTNSCIFLKTQPQNTRLDVIWVLLYICLSNSGVWTLFHKETQTLCLGKVSEKGVGCHSVTADSRGSARCLTRPAAAQRCSGFTQSFQVVFNCTWQTGKDRVNFEMYLL